MKKAISPVISTILLIMLSIAVVIIVAGVLIPFVRESLAESKECFEISDQLSIEYEYTCHYNISNIEMINISVKRGMKEIEVEGVLISVSGMGSSETFEIKNGTIELGMRMIDGSPILIIPGRGETRTFSLNTSLDAIESAEVAPILQGGRICDSTDRTDIESCEFGF